MLIYSAQYLKNTHPPTTTLKVIKIAKKKIKPNHQLYLFSLKRQILNSPYMFTLIFKIQG